MNKKNLFSKHSQTKGHGRILKKGVAVLMLSGIMVGGGIAVFADEVEPSLSEVVTASNAETELEKTEEAVAGAEEEVDSATDVTPTIKTMNLAEVDEATAENEAMGETEVPGGMKEPAVATRATKPVQATVVASISNAGDGKASIQTTVNLNATVSSDVKAGDYIDFTFANIGANTLNGKEVRTADGTLIGTLAVVSYEQAYDVQMKGAEAEKNTLESRGANTVVRLTFNPSVEGLKDIVFGLSFVETQTVTIVSKDKTVNQTVSVNGQVVGNASFTNKATVPVDIKVPKLKVLSSNDIYTDGNTLTPKNLQVGLETTDEVVVKAGDRMVLTLDDTAPIAFNIKNNPIGKVIDFNRTRGYSQGMEVNNNDVVRFSDTTPMKLKIVSVTDKAITFEVVTDSGGFDASFTGILVNGFVITDVSANSVDEGNSVLKNVTFTSSLTRAGKQLANNSALTTDLRIYGAKVNVSALNKKGSVVVKYKDVNGKVISEDVVVLPETNVGFGIEYDTTEQKRPEIVVTQPDGSKITYLYVKTEGEETGKLSEGETVVTYIYRDSRDVPKEPAPIPPKDEPKQDIPKEEPKVETSSVGTKTVTGQSLPHTGESSSFALMLSGIATFIGSLFGFLKKKKGE